MKQLFFRIALLLFTWQSVVAQDFHFSQFDANPFYINPALLGERLNEEQGIQINANYRDQMAEFTNGQGAFRSIAIGVDEPINARVSTGQYFFNDKSPGGAFNTMGLMLSGAYKLIDPKSDKEGNHNLTVGLQLGAFNMSVHPDNFTYASQYSSASSDGFDRSLPTGETYAQQSDYHLNINFGMYYRVRNKRKNLTGYGGLSIYNISKTNESFLGLYSPAALRFNFHGGLQYKLNEQLSMAPQFIYMNQAKANQLNLNVLFFSRMQGTDYEPIFGVGFRNKDAVIFQLGLKYKSATFRMSYDALTNYTKMYKNRGLEFSLVYTFAKRKAVSGIKETTPPSAGGENN